MDLGRNRLWVRVSQAVPAAAPGMESSWSPSVPIMGIAVMGIVGTALLLVSYYVFVIKCCCHHEDGVFFFFYRRRRDNNSLQEGRGLEEGAIRSIPILNLRSINNDRGRNERECAVCLNEFEEDEKVRFIPQCGHVFHMDCLDIWLHNNANCPLCRTSVSGGPMEEDYVVIELGDSSASTPPPPLSTNKHKNMMMFQTSIRDDQQIQPIHRRSFSMDSKHHKRDAILTPPPNHTTTLSRTTFFSLANPLSRSAVLPLSNFQQQ